MLPTPTLAEASHILLTGSSAGASGLRFNLDRLADQLQFADVKGVNDAAVIPITDPALNEREQVMLRKKYKHWKPRLDASCVEAAGDEPWNCLQGVYEVEKRALFNAHLLPPGSTR